MNKKGFTLIELITTFALASVILILLINVIVLIKNVYTKSNTKTELLINQANLSNSLNSKLKKDNIKSYESCTDGNFCYEFTLSDDSVVRLEVFNTKIKFGNFVYTLVDDTTIETPSLIDDKEFLVIKIPIKNKLFVNRNFGINLVYVY